MTHRIASAHRPRPGSAGCPGSGGPQGDPCSSSITRAIRAANACGRAAVLPYFMLGYPTLGRSIECVRAAIDSGADVIEAGLPFSDPLADGPVIQQAAQVALDRGATPQACIEAVSRLTGPGRPPIVLMTYFNLLLTRGLERTVGRLRGAGLAGLIIPDLTFEAYTGFRDVLDSSGLDAIFLVAPTSSPERVRAIARVSRGFLYLVAVTGVTGARRDAAPGLAAYVTRVRAEAGGLPLCVGFGIAGPTQVRAAARVADGVIVGSALVETILRAGSGAARAVGRYVESLTRAARRGGDGA